MAEFTPEEHGNDNQRNGRTKPFGILSCMYAAALETRPINIAVVKSCFSSVFIGALWNRIVCLKRFYRSASALGRLDFLNALVTECLQRND